MSNTTLTNLADFTAEAGLGKLITQARFYNDINVQLAKLLPAVLNSLQLCRIHQNCATLTTQNQAIAFRAQKQQASLIKILQTIQGLTHIQQITIIVEIAK